MTWKDDIHGLLFKSNELKLYKNSHTWAMKLSNLKQQNGVVRIITHSLSDIDYIKTQIDRRPFDIFIICNTIASKTAIELKARYPNIRIAINQLANSRILLIEPATIYLGSQDFGKSSSHETVVGIRSGAAHDWYVDESFRPLWNESEKL